MDAANVKALEEVVNMLKEDPTLAYDPKLGFFKDFMGSWGAKPPPVGEKKKAPEPEVPPPAEEEEEEEPEEPEEVEEEDPDRLPEDSEPYPEKGPDGEIEFTDAQMDKMGEVKQQGAEALEDGDLKKALEKYTEVVKMGNTTAMVYAKRAEILLKLKRPNACIADCSAAIAINPDSGKAFKVRGKAQRLIGHWQEAHKDISQGQQLDFDDDLVDMQKLVAERNKKISERQTRIRLREERIAKKKKEADIKARKAAAHKAYEEAKAATGGGFPGMPGGMGGMPGGMPGMPGGMGGMPGGIDPSMMAGLLQDPDLLQALQNPKMSQAFQDIMSNPANMSKYSDDPEVMAVVQKLMTKMGGAGADLGAMFGGGHGGGHGQAHDGGHEHAGGCCDGGHESGHGDGHGHGSGHGGSMPESAGGASVEEID